MTTDTKALIDRLMKGCDCEKCKLDACCCPEMEQAAQALRDLTAEVARLKALGDGLAVALGVIQANAMNEGMSLIDFRYTTERRARRALAAWEKKDSR